MLELKLIHVSKLGPWGLGIQHRRGHGWHTWWDISATQVIHLKCCNFPQHKLQKMFSITLIMEWVYWLTWMLPYFHKSPLLWSEYNTSFVCVHISSPFILELAISYYQQVNVYLKSFSLSPWKGYMQVKEKYIIMDIDNCISGCHYQHHFWFGLNTKIHTK